MTIGLPATNESTQPWRIALIGCGGFAENVLPVYSRLSGVKVTACIDENAVVARAMAERLDAECWSTDLVAALETPTEGAVISTPNHLHVEQATALLRSGRHVLLQKPAARNATEARQLFHECAVRPDLKLGIYMSMLDFGLWWELREALQQQHVLGDIVQVSVRLGHTGGLHWSKQKGIQWRFSREKTGGGALIMLGVHYVHFVRWLLGVKVRRVMAQGANLRCPRIQGEDICQLQAELENGVLLQLAVAWNSHGEHVALYGTTGTFLYLDNELVRVNGTRPWRTSAFEYTDYGRWQSFPNVCPPRLDDASNLTNQHRVFWSTLRSGGEPMVDMLDGLQDLEVTDAAYRSMVSGAWEAVTHA